MQRMLLSKAERLPWLSLKERSRTWRLSLHLLSHALERPQRPSREQNARPRNLLLLRERIERTKIACLSWLQSSKERSRHTNSRLKRLKRLLLSTLPSSAKLGKNLRRLRNVQSLLWSCKRQPESSRNYQKDAANCSSLFYSIAKQPISKFTNFMLLIGHPHIGNKKKIKIKFVILLYL